MKGAKNPKADTVSHTYKKQNVNKQIKVIRNTKLKREKKSGKITQKGGEYVNLPRFALKLDSNPTNYIYSVTTSSGESECKGDGKGKGIFRYKDTKNNTVKEHIINALDIPTNFTDNIICIKKNISHQHYDKRVMLNNNARNKKLIDNDIFDLSCVIKYDECVQISVLKAKPKKHTSTSNSSSGITQHIDKFGIGGINIKYQPIIVKYKRQNSNDITKSSKHMQIINNIVLPPGIGFVVFYKPESAAAPAPTSAAAPTPASAPNSLNDNIIDDFTKCYMVVYYGVMINNGNEASDLRLGFEILFNGNNYTKNADNKYSLKHIDNTKTSLFKTKLASPDILSKGFLSVSTSELFLPLTQYNVNILYVIDSKKLQNNPEPEPETTTVNNSVPEPEKTTEKKIEPEPVHVPEPKKTVNQNVDDNCNTYINNLYNTINGFIHTSTANTNTNVNKLLTDILELYPYTRISTATANNILVL